MDKGNEPSMEDATHTIVRLARSLGWKAAALLSVTLALFSLAVALLIVVRWPVEQFKGEAVPPFWEHRHPAIRVLGLIGKNVAGYATVVLGIVLALPGVPGQGLLLILIGLTLLNFPGKRRLELRLIHRPAIRRVINSVRTRFGRPPLELD